MRKQVLVSLLFMVVSQGSFSSEAQTLKSGNFTLTIIPANKTSSGVILQPMKGWSAASVVVQRTPADIFVKHGDTLVDYSGGYSRVQRNGAALIAKANVSTPSGSRFEVTDVYKASDANGDFRVDRKVDVIRASSADQGFNSRFSLGFEQPSSMSSLEFFSPAVWYKQNVYAGEGAIASDYTDKYFYYREMRTALPLIAMRNPSTGIAVALCHLDPHISAGVNPLSKDWLVDGSVQYASLGAERLAAPQIGVVYPAIEGQKTYLAKDQEFVNRSHPIRVGFEQHYSVMIKIGRYLNYQAALAANWRYFYNLANPVPAPVPLRTIYKSDIELLNHYAQVHDGVMGWPFVVSVPNGRIEIARNGKPSISYQMGYVGQQLPDAYQLIRYGLLTSDTAILAKGIKIVNFWAQKSALPSGLPQVWYNVNPPTFRNSALIYMRQLSDGMEGALAAAEIMRAHHRAQPLWEKFCSKFGNWLVAHQNSDGSFYRAYNVDSTVAQASKLNTTHPIRFLVRLYTATSDKRYLQAAIRAGEFSLKNIVQPWFYAGGTVDRPEPVLDKEAGVEAIHAFLSLYGVTHERKWLDAAVSAAEFTETWELSWRYPIETNEPAFRRAGTRGQSFIKSGISGVDIFLSFEACDYYRLFLYTGDAHFRRFAKILLANTKLTTDWDDSLSYAQPGLVREASELANIRANPNIGWLPWLTDAELSSMTELDDIFGSMSIDEIEELPLPTRLRLNDGFPGRPGADKSIKTTDLNKQPKILHQDGF